MAIPILASMLLLAAAPRAMAATEPPAATCPASPTPPPPGLEGWAHQSAVSAGAIAARAVPLPIGAGVTATLLPTPGVAYAVPPEKPAAAASSGGLFAFTVATPGRYRVALASGAWIDVVSGTTTMASVAHGHGAECTGIRKTVDFDLKPGRYLLQVAGSASATLPMMIARMP